MLAYRHAFHAGNHADVLKHITLNQVLQHMSEKDKGWRYVDTHAGAGGYSLEGSYANKRAEYVDGIGRLWDRKGLPEPVAALVKLVRDFNGGGALVQYPGSPAIAHAAMRPQDQLRLYELHPTDHKILSSYLGDTEGVEIHMSDGFGCVRPQLPPPTRRGVMLVDPPYELKADYTRVLALLREVLAKFAECVVIIWVPQLQLIEAKELPKRLKATADAQAKKGWLHARLTVAQGDARGFGLLGSSVFVVNPPHTLEPALRETLPWLATELAQFDGAQSIVEVSTR